MPSKTKNYDRFKTIVASGKRAEQVRAMAGFLFEYTMPGMRRVPNFHPLKDQPAKVPMTSAVVYTRVPRFFQRFQALYRDPSFEEYLHQYNGAPACLEQPVIRNTMTPSGTTTPTIASPRWKSPCITFPDNEIPVPIKDITFWELMPEYRCSQMIYDWMHIGEKSLRFGNVLRRRATLFWIVASDDVRREALLFVHNQQQQQKQKQQKQHYTEDQQRMIQLTKSALGQDYVMRIEKRLHKMMWQCEQPFKADTRFYEKRQAERYTKLGFEISKEEAAYMGNLYNLPKRLDLPTW
jgi:hypothetical protein